MKSVLGKPGFAAINRRQALRLMAGISSAAWVGGCADVQIQQSRQRPNLLFILADDLHVRGLGIQGNQEVYTPNLDRLAREGTRFTQAHVSNPICTPSRAALLTGQYGFRNGVTFFGQKIQPDSPRIAQVLAEQGYTTAFTGKWHNDQRPNHHGFQLTKHVFLGGMMNDYSSTPVVDGPDDAKREIPRYPTEVFTEAALDLLHEALRREPFALFVWYTAPHDPRRPTPEYEALYRDGRISLPPNFMPQPPFDPGTLEIRDEKLLPRPLDPDALRQEIGWYYGMITHLDAQIGLLLHALEESGRQENTLVIFSSDNGLALGSHGLLGKQNLYEEGVRVPLFARGPGVCAHHTCETLVDLMDLMPTMCECAGAAIPVGVQGRSLVPWLHGKQGRARDIEFSHYDDLFRMIKIRRYKLIHHLKSGREELFDLAHDPYELNDLSRSHSHETVLVSLRPRLLAWRQEMEDPTLAAAT